jgi:PAS domain S-box-containing protein
VVAFRDVTERKRVEEALKSSEEKYRLLVENANDAIFILQDGVMKFHNSRTLELFGYSAGELVSFPFPKLIHPEDRDFVEGIYKGRMEGKEVPDTYSFRIVDKSGETHWVQINSVTILWGGKPAALGFMRDITLEKRLEAQLQHAQKMESIGTLAGGIAHDFNNILGGILGYASFMKNKMTEDHAFYGYVDTIESGAMRASELTSQLLAFARGGRFNIKPINLNRTVEETLAIINRTFDKSISIETRLQDDLPTVEADAGQLQQVLLNLCVNARDAMPAGGTLTIESKAETITGDFAEAPVDAEPGPYVVLTVSDTGVGMDSETAQRVFEPFFSTKEEGKGTGLGLSMAYGVVKNHGGFLRVEGDLGKGATFRIYLPASGKPELKETPVTDAPIGGDELILVVDDEKAIRDLAVEMLDSFGYRVIAVEDGVEAVEVFKAHADDIDLVVLDMVMPKMGGRETFLKLREISPAVKVILSTGYSQVGRAQEILDEGVRGFIQKPYRINTLLSTVRNVLEP